MCLFDLIFDLYSIVCTPSLQFPVSCTSFMSISTNVGYTNTKTMVGIQIADGKILDVDVEEIRAQTNNCLYARS